MVVKSKSIVAIIKYSTCKWLIIYLYIGINVWKDDFIFIMPTCWYSFFLFSFYIVGIVVIHTKNQIHIFLLHLLQHSYKKWTCSRQFSLFHGDIEIPPCNDICENVQNRCPFFRPSINTVHAGEPSFLCKCKYNYCSYIFIFRSSSFFYLSMTMIKCVKDWLVKITCIIAFVFKIINVRITQNGKSQIKRQNKRLKSHQTHGQLQSNS